MTKYTGWLAAGLAAIALSACGGDDDKPATAAELNATPTAEATPAAGHAGEVTITPLGTTLKVGEPAVIDYQDATTRDKGIIELTPVKIEKGTLDDFKNIDLDDAQKKSTPYYAEISVKNVGTTSLDGASPHTYINGVDDRGQDQNEIIFFGDFERCDQESPKKFRPGDTYKGCLVYLIPDGGSLTGFHWIAFDQKSGKSDLNWK